MDIIIEVEYLFGAAGEFVVKELSMLSTSAEIQFTWSYQPPYHWQDLPSNIRHKNLWTCEHMHRIQWSEGKETYDHLRSNIIKVLPSDARLYTKGLRKAAFLSMLLDRPVLELGEMGCPKIGQLPETYYRCQNQDLRVYHRRGHRCATVKCIRFAEWLRANIAVSSDGMDTVE